MQDVDFRLLDAIVEVDAKFNALYVLLLHKKLITEDEFNTSFEAVTTGVMAETIDTVKYKMLMQDIVERHQKMTEEDESYLRKSIAKYDPEEDVDDLIETLRWISNKEH